MVDVGQYQNEITSLSALNVEDYERIFKIFKQSVDNKEFYTYNILKKIEFPTLGKDFLQFYDVQSRTPLTTLSYRIYGDIKSWWIIYLLNKDKFDGAPFYVNGGTEISYIPLAYKTAVYVDITNSTIFGGRHY
jgi:hypothetical protein